MDDKQFQQLNDANLAQEIDLELEFKRLRAENEWQARRMQALDKQYQDAVLAIRDLSIAEANARTENVRLRDALRYAREQIDGNTYGRTAGLKKIDEALGEQAKVWTQEEIDAETARSDDDWSCREAPNGTAEG